MALPSRTRNSRTSRVFGSNSPMNPPVRELKYTVLWTPLPECSTTAYGSEPGRRWNSSKVPVFAFSRPSVFNESAEYQTDPSRLLTNVSRGIAFGVGRFHSVIDSVGPDPWSAAIV